MIKLDVIEDYCQECVNFAPDLETTALYSDNEPYSICHIIRCLYHEQCLRVIEKTKKMSETEIIEDCPGGVHE